MLDATMESIADALGADGWSIRCFQVPGPRGSCWQVEALGREGRRHIVRAPEFPVALLALEESVRAADPGFP